MKFAHFADVHIGSWRDPSLAEVSTKAFLQALDECKEEKVDFVLISGDLFNTSLPSIDRMKEVVAKIKELKDFGIRFYVIAGSHDFSPTGRTMLDVLENTGLFVNVMRGEVDEGRLKLNFTVDEKTGAKITGIIGKMGMLDKHYYEKLDLDKLEAEEGFKIFMFHTQISEFKPKDLEKMDSTPISYFPKGFNYYAGGHPHFVFKEDVPGYGVVTHPGPMFPNNFREVEKLKNGGYYLVETGEQLNVEWKPVKIHEVESLNIDCNNKSVEKVNEELATLLQEKDLKNTIVTLRFFGTLSSGKQSDIESKNLLARLYRQGAVFVMKNTAKLESKEFQEVNIQRNSVEEIEQALITEHIGRISSEFGEREEAVTKQLMESLSKEKAEGETNVDFEKRILDDVKQMLEIE